MSKAKRPDEPEDFSRFTTESWPVYSHVANDLIKHSRKAEVSARGVVTQLFPAIYTASMRMSSRAISDFLKEKHQINLSAVTIAKAIRQPRKHLEVCMETIAPAAAFLADVHGIAVTDILENLEKFEHITAKRPNLETMQDREDLKGATNEDYSFAWDVIRREWFMMLDGAFRLMAITATPAHVWEGPLR